MEEAGWTHFRLRSQFQAGVVACLENFLDCPHATFVHRHWFRAPTAEVVRCQVRRNDDGAEAAYFNEPRKASAVWWLLAPRQGGMRHVDRFVAPHTSEVSYDFPSGLSYRITSVCTPVEEDQTLVHTTVSFRPRWPWLGAGVRLFFKPLSQWIIRQDMRMLALQSRRRRPSGQTLLSTSADLLGPHIVAWRQALLAGMGPP